MRSFAVFRGFPWVNLSLFLVTVATTLSAGAFLSGQPIGGVGDLARHGWLFAVPLLLALGTHEMGHFVVARMHGLNPSWPYFIPAPTLIGTFGAVIRMNFLRPPSRKQLFDVGIAGPLAGLVVSVVFLVLGTVGSAVDVAADLQTTSLAQATWAWLQNGDSALFSRALSGPYLLFGDSLLVKGVLLAVTGSADTVLQLHPVAFAGWVGLFVTVLNLMPIGQLDGGHVAFALLGKRFRYLPWVVIPILVVLGFFGWIGWFVWAILVAVLGVRHPPTTDEPIGRARLALAWVCLVIFVLIFTPAPIRPAW